MTTDYGPRITDYGPIAMSPRQFDKVVRRVLESLPDELKAYLENVVVDVEDEPDERLLRDQGFTAVEIAEGATLYGLFAPCRCLIPRRWRSPRDPTASSSFSGRW